MAELPGGQVGAVPAVAEASDHRQGALTPDAATPDAEAFLHGFGVAAGVGKGEVLTLEVHVVLGEEEADDLDALLQDVESLPERGEGDAVGAVLVLVPAGADAEFDAPAAEVVHGGEGVGEDGRVAVVHPQDKRADTQVLRLAGEGGHDGRPLPVVAVVLVHEGCFVEVVGGVDPVEAGGIGPRPEAAELRHLDVLLNEVHPELHLSCSFDCCASLRAVYICRSAASLRSALARGAAAPVAPSSACALAASLASSVAPGAATMRAREGLMTEITHRFVETNGIQHTHRGGGGGAPGGVVPRLPRVVVLVAAPA